MNRIIYKEQLSADVFLMRLEAPLIAAERKAGQFVILQLDSTFSERIPLTIATADQAEGSITIIFQAIGNTTKRLSLLSAGQTIENLLGPLGTPTHIAKFGHVVCVGGGIGVAPLHPIIEALKAAGNRLTIITGARNESLLILQDRMKALADELIIVTDDGSVGRKGLVTEPLKELCAGTDKPDLVIAIGPPIMMKFCAETTRPFGVHTMVSLNTIMVDGTGMCGGCRVSVGGETRFVCVDGPEFDGHLVDFDNMMLRLKSFRKKEEEDRHACFAEAQGEHLEQQRSNSGTGATS